MIAGVDPGANGAIAFLSDEGHLLNVEDLPVAKVKVGKTMRSRLITASLAAMLTNRRPVAVYLEEVQPIASAGSVAAFGLGKSAGLIEGVVTALGIQLVMVRPKVWQKHFGLSGGDKGASRARAAQLWPGAVDRFERVKDDGRAEASLLGLYGAHHMQGAA